MKIKINNKTVDANENETILTVLKRLNINVPTLCFLEGINENASCRMCVVEIKGIDKLVTSCTTKISEGMEIYTESEKVKKARKQNLELILSNHNKDCINCVRNGKCQLQNLIKEYKIDESKIKTLDKKFKVDTSSSYLVRDNSKCILCGRCVAVCKNVQGIEAIGKNKRGMETEIGCAFDKNLSEVPCIGCGQCTLVCPTGALVEKNDVELVKGVLAEKKKHVVAITAPSVRVALGEEFGMEIGTNVKGKMVAALKKLGFDKVFDVNYSADLTIMEEATELLDRVKNNRDLPMFTSCCPAWIKYLEHNYPDMTDNLSTCKSPQQMLGALIKTYYAEKNDIDPKNVFVVSVMPCTAKKFEITREEDASGFKDVDVVLTTREAARLIKKEKVKFEELTEQEFDNPLGEGASVIFGNSGGVMTSALRTFYNELTSAELEEIEYENSLDLIGVKEATINIDGLEVKVAIVDGIKNAKLVLEKIKSNELNYHFIEVMSCPGGCINGGGQPLVDLARYNQEEIKKLRSQSIIEEFNQLPIRKAHENSSVEDLYNTYLGYPGSKRAHHLLHTEYKKREKYQN